MQQTSLWCSDCVCDICWLFCVVLCIVIIGIAGSTDNSKVEMFNGDRELHLRVIKEKEDHYCVRVAKRPNVSAMSTNKIRSKFCNTH